MEGCVMYRYRCMYTQIHHAQEHKIIYLPHIIIDILFHIIFL